MDTDAIRKMIQRHEGFKGEVYLDHLGNPTIGYGHCFAVGSKLPNDILEAIFDYDFKLAEQGYTTLDLELDDVRKGALIDLIFNMGLPRLKNFKLMLAALKRKDYLRASEELKCSRYYSQVPVRAEEIRKIILNG